MLSAEARHYLNEVLDVIQNNSVERNVNWDEFRRVTIQEAAQSMTTSDTYPAISNALKRMGDNHSSLLSPDYLGRQNEGATGGASGLGIRVRDLVVVAVFPDSSADRAAIKARDRILFVDGKPVTTDGSYQKAVEKAMMGAAKGIELTLKRGRSESRNVHLEFCEPGYNLPLKGGLIADGVGYIELPQFFTSFTDQEKAKAESDRYAERVQTLIRELDQDHISGWIVDIRLNNGGNMWPMLAGIGPILGEGKVGRMISSSGSFEFEYRKGGAGVRQGSIFQAHV